tara:strand:+ start:1581 stop:1865 length:285 start_codon:yes stop_codon:yes gene_type:complete
MKLDEYITEAIDNIRTDRETTKELLNDAINYMSSKHDAHETVGNIAAKYVETLQRSNEQLVKVMGLLQKREVKQEGLSETDKKELFDLISSGDV